MRVARYIGGGQLVIAEEPSIACPPGGLKVRTEACGLCSGELMDWYMDRKVPHVLGHEVSGVVIESEDERFPVGSHVFPHHHAPCMACELCARGLYVHCETWRKTKLLPGGMATQFGVPAANLNDTHRVDDLRPIDAALIEPLACVAKSLRLAGPTHTAAVIGLGAMGLLHMAVLPGAIGYELNPARRDWATAQGWNAEHPDEAQPADTIFVCPGHQVTLDLAIKMVEPGGTIILFAPQPPSQETVVDMNRLYFADVTLRNAYSCGPDDCAQALQWIREGRVKAEQIVSDFVSLDDLPEAYTKMKKGEILKAMTVFE